MYVGEKMGKWSKGEIIGTKTATNKRKNPLTN